MWTIIKFDKKYKQILKNNLKNKIGNDLIFYSPILLIQKFKKNKLINKEFSLLGNYLFCFHEKFKNESFLNSLKFTKGLKYFLNGYSGSQRDIETFIKKCKNFEDNKGYLSQNFFEIYKNNNYKFISGPFVEKIFKIVDFQKNKIEILLGQIKTTINKEKFLFAPL